jgi:transcriptional regulator with XRE-family HTH domain
METNRPESQADRLRALRTKAGLDPEGIADQIGISPSWYEDLERDPDELENTLDLAQLRKLAVLLNVGLGYLLTAAILPDEVVSLSFLELSRRLRGSLEHAPDVEALEAKIGWELAAFLKRPSEEGWGQRVPFFRDLCRELGLDWRGVLKYCESIREE